MNICVLVKQVVDVELNIRVKDDALIEEGLKYVLSSWDEIAVEAALQITETIGKGTITLITVGPGRAADALRTGLAMGAHRVIHVLDPAVEGSDSYAYAKVFAKMLENESFNLVIGGRQAEDTDAGLTMSMLAEFLNLPQAANLVNIDSVDDKQLKLHRRGDNGIEVMDLSLPAVLTVNDSFAEPRTPTIRGIIQAKNKPIETVTLSDIGLEPEMAGARGRQTIVHKLIEPEKRKAGHLFEGEEVKTVKQVLELLVNEDFGDGKLVSLLEQ